MAWTGLIQRRSWADVVVVLGVVVTVVAVALGAAVYEGQQRAGRGAVDVVARVSTGSSGGWAPREIRVRQGQEARLRLTSEDVTHGFLIPELGVESGPIVPGSYRVISFTPDRPGTFRYYCNVLCGHRHGAMVGTLIVEPVSP